MVDVRGKNVPLHGDERGMNSIERYVRDTARVCGIPTYDVSTDSEGWKCTK